MVKRYNRKESFRYTFEQPVACTMFFHVRSAENRLEKSQPYTGEIMNMSPNGLQVYLNSNVLEKKMVKMLEFHIKLASEDQLVLTGEIRWKKNYLSGFLYGISLDDESMEKTIIQELKKYAKSLLAEG